ncbi:MAG: DUF1016 family protein [Muribaculaceae bacterium]|nr:DUF1016 family protein [Muribaculaceae bacterium]
MANEHKRPPKFIDRSPSVAGQDYSRLLHELKENYRKAQIKAAVRINSDLLEYYWYMGRQISSLQAKSKWGSAFFDTLSLDLKAEFPNQSGFSSANIRYIVRWYNFYNQDVTILQQVVEEFKEGEKPNLQQSVAEIRQRSVDELEMPTDFGLIPWGHHIAIFTKAKSVSEALFYIEKTIEANWSRPELNEKIKEDLFRNHGKAITNFEDKLPAPYSRLADSIFKSPYNLEFIGGDIENERQLEDALAKDITRFLLELGNGFAYVGRQMQLQMPGGQTFIPDMVFYHTRLKCYVVIELKLGAFIPEYAGKLNFYISALDELLKQDDDNPSIGLLICRSRDNAVVEWAFRGTSQPMGVAAFEHKAAELLPTAEQLQKIIETYHYKMK